MDERGIFSEITADGGGGSRTRARFPPQTVLTRLVLPPFRATGSLVAACPRDRSVSSRDPDGSGMVGVETPTAEEFIEEVRRRTRRHEG
jgi:hypothetical protein